MQITQSCAKCLYDKQKRNVQDEKYLKEIFTEVQEIGERIEIYDAMTESAIDVSQDPFLANLPGAAHA